MFLPYFLSMCTGTPIKKTTSAQLIVANKFGLISLMVLIFESFKIFKWNKQGMDRPNEIASLADTPLPTLLFLPHIPVPCKFNPLTFL